MICLLQLQYGLDALPGMAFLSAFLDAVSIYFVLICWLIEPLIIIKLIIYQAGRPRGYLPADNPSESHASQASWEHTPDTTQAAQRINDRAYGSI